MLLARSRKTHFFSVLVTCVLLAAHSSVARAKEDSQGASATAAPSTTVSQEPTGSGDDDVLEGATSLDTELMLNTPVITATGREQSRALAPANVVTWERDEIRRHGWTTLAQVLANTPGLYVNDDLVLPSLGVRGVAPGLRGGSRIVRVMINGIAVNFRPDLTAFLGQEYIPFETVERIEVAKGALSALYGANAFLATVNVVTRAIDRGASGELGLNTRIQRGTPGLGYGGQVSYGSEHFTASVAYDASRTDRSGLRLSRTFDNQDGTSALFRGFFDGPSKTDLAKPSSLYARTELSSESLGIVQLQGGRQELDSKAEFQPGSVLTHASRVHLRNDWGNLTYIYGFGRDLTMTASAGVSSGRPYSDEVLLANSAPRSSYTRNFNSLAFDAAASVDAKLPANLDLKVGADLSRDREQILFFTERDLDTGTAVDRIGVNAKRHETISNVGAYAQLGGNPFNAVPNLYVLGNARVDSPNLFDTQFTWRAGLAYQFGPRVITKLFFGRAFQTPSAVQIFAQPGFGLAYNTIGNRNLRLNGFPAIEPQKVFSSELATTVAVTNSFVIEGSVYYQNVIDKVELSQVTTNFAARNLAGQEFVGGELGFHASSARFMSYLTGSTQALTYTNDDGVRKFGVKTPAEFPSFTVYAGLTTRLPEVFAAVDLVARIVGPRGSSQSNTLLNNGQRYDLPSYAALDLTLSSLGLFLFGENAETRLIANVQNLTNNRFTYPGYGGFDVPNIGRAWFFKVSQTF